MNKKLINILVTIIFLSVILCQAVNALSFTVTMSPSSTTVKESTEFTVTFKISNLDVGSNGISTISGYLKYDTTAFETINESSIEGLNSWSSSYDATTGKISLTKSSFVKTSQEFLKISFKTKSGTTGVNGNITLSNIVASNSEEQITASDISTTISIGDGTTNTTNAVNNVTNNTVANNSIVISNNTVNNTTNTTTNNTVNKVVNNTTSNKVNNTVNTTVPYTGVDDTLIGLIIAIIAVALIFYLKFEKVNNQLK